MHFFFYFSISLKNCNLTIENEAKLLKQAEKPLELTIWEKIFIQKNRNTIFNFDIPDEKNLISKYIKPLNN